MISAAAKTDWPGVLTALGLVITAVTGLVNAIIGFRGRKKIIKRVDDVHDEVKTGNGMTLAALVDAMEGRRIEADIPKARRTTAEQKYVDELNQLPAAARARLNKPLAKG